MSTPTFGFIKRSHVVLAASLFIASLSPVLAQDKPLRAYTALVPDQGATAYSFGCDASHRYHCSGTRGRLGDGATPAFPEGPGNVSN
ncbi:hypothetical protein [Beijerinckia indica]|nr:hypothetical protein [Beijerinckia indica]